MFYHHSLVKRLMQFIKEIHLVSPWKDQTAFFSSLHRLVPFDHSVAFMKVNPLTSRILPSSMTLWGDEADVMRDHNDYFWQFKQPIVARIVGHEFQNLHFPNTLMQYLPKSQYEAYRIDFWEKHHKRFSYAQYFKTREGWFSLYLTRSSRSRDFSEEEQQAISFIAPHLQMILSASEPEIPTVFADAQGQIVCNGLETAVSGQKNLDLMNSLRSILPSWIGWFLAEPFKPLRAELVVGSTTYKCLVSPVGTGRLPLFRVSWETEDQSNTLPARDLHLFSQKYRLSPREKEILALAVAGKQRKEMAQMLGLSVDTVKEYLGTTYRKAGVEGKGALVAKVLSSVSMPDDGDSEPSNAVK